MLEFELSQAVTAARRAGEIIRSFFDGRYTVRAKAHDHPVTDADLRANECIHAIIQQAFPNDGWLSEETRDSSDRLGRRRVWIVDPLDGTKEFIEKIPEFCVSIALVEDGVPIVGVIYNPISSELFSAARGLGMYRNGTQRRTSETSDLANTRVLVSRSETARGEWSLFKNSFRLVPTGSVAYKLALVAAGVGDATCTLTPKHEWDVCAGAALVCEAGGQIADCNGQPLKFNQPDPIFPGMIATNGRLFESILATTKARRR